jgi:hypothetical protein
MSAIMDARQAMPQALAEVPEAVYVAQAAA